MSSPLDIPARGFNCVGDDDLITVCKTVSFTIALACIVAIGAVLKDLIEASVFLSPLRIELILAS